MTSAMQSSVPRPGWTRPRAWFAVVIIGAALVICYVIYLALTAQFLRNEERMAPQRAQFFADAMDAALTRLEHLPHVLALDTGVQQALQKDDATQLNPVLADIAQRADAEFIFVLDRDGRTVASSNFADAESLVGRSYRFRPYFRDAIAGGEGRFYAVGVTTGRPGYFIAEPVRDLQGAISGVVVVKIAFNDLSQTLTQSGQLVFVTNAQNVVLASSGPDLTYGLLAPLTPDQEARLAEQRQFGDQALFPLDWSASAPARARLNGTDYVWTTAQLRQEDWTLHLISPLRTLQRQAMAYIAFGLMAVFALGVAAAVYRASQLRQALAISNADRRRLATEIEDRKAAEVRLEAARKALARQNQLAALGQLSASITHELGQPISAMRNYLVAEEIATGATPGSVLPEMTGLVERMQRILGQLRLFGRPPSDLTTAFDVNETLTAAVKLVSHTAKAAGVGLDVQMHPTALRLHGQPERFEQVIVNLLRNAIDAATGQPDAAVKLTMHADDDQIRIEVADNGTGLGDMDITDLTEPFFSTKPSGQGMGLGLAISGQIVSEMRGTLAARNATGQGAIFVITLPQKGPRDG
ncbi:sensor histidine kinase [Yoonia sp. 208BN28-4]|uniref:sensor histidine kinase n=1 Tax=Yoonia sp. 208BN28-4 TaxID=3126505 RepID=UPI0030A0C226